MPFGLAGAVALTMLFQSAPGADALEPTFSGTLVSTYPDGRTARLWLERDGDYTGRGRTGGRSSGVWRVRDGELCLNQRRPIPVPMTYCTPIVRGGVGHSWRARAVTGEPITVTLVAGRS